MSRTGDVIIKAQDTPWLLTPPERAFMRMDEAGVVDPYADVPLEDDPFARMPPPDDASVATAECVSLSQWIEAQAERYESLGTELGHWIGRRLRELSETARLTLASTPGELDEREQSLIDDHHARLCAQGYDAGVADCAAWDRPL